MRLFWTGLVCILAAGCACEPGDHDVSVYLTSGPENQTTSGTATIDRTADLVTFKFTTGELVMAELHGVPADVFPAGASVYTVIAEREEPIPGGDRSVASTEIATYDADSVEPAALRAVAWGSRSLPQPAGAELETDGTECEREEDGCTRHYVRVRATVDNELSLSVAPGAEGAQGRLRMGNGASHLAPCEGQAAYFVGYLAIAK